MEAVNALPKKYRTVIHLFYYEDMPIEQIRRMLGIRYDAVAKRLSRARRMLREDLEGESYYEMAREGLSK